MRIIFSLLISLAILGCGSRPSDQQVFDAASDILRSRIAHAVGDDAASGATITIDQASLKTFGSDKWKMLVTVSLDESKAGPKFDQFIAGGLNGTSLVTVEMKDGKLDVTDSTREPVMMPQQ